MTGRVYDLQRWRSEVQPAQLAAHPICQHCAWRGIIKTAEHVDHVLAISAGGDPWDANNLQSLCQDCHNRKTAADEGKQATLGCDVEGVPIARKAPPNAKRGRGH